MKTRELVRLLQEEDPGGDLEAVIDGVPIYVVERLPAFYDGNLQMLIQDEEKNPFYNVTGYKVTSKGEKVLLRSMNIRSVLWDNPEATVDLSGLHGFSLEQWQKKVEKLRTESDMGKQRGAVDIT